MTVLKVDIGNRIPVTADDGEASNSLFDWAETTKQPPAALAKLRVVSLFAGIGGFDRAFELSNCEVVMQCEYDRFCQSVLRRHWPTVKMDRDIRTLLAADIPEADVWTAGFPCQDVSLARGCHGRSGFKGQHTSLFFKMMDLIRERLPRVVLLENVVGLLNSHKGQDFALVLRELTAAGYAVSWRVLNARYFGAPQSRSRVFLCAWKGDAPAALAALFESAPSAKLPSERLGFTTPTTHPSGAIVPLVSYCVAATSGRHTGNDWSRSYISYAERVRRPTPTESERLQGFPADWSLPEDNYPIPARGLDGERYRAVGNAVCVPVIQWIAKRIVGLTAQACHRVPPDKFGAVVKRLAPELTKSPVTLSFVAIMDKVDAGEFVHRWKTGGCAWGDTIIEATTSPAPAKVLRSEFKDVLDAQTPDDRYFLTANAATGILRRAESVGRTLFAPMSKALAKMVAGTSGTSEVAAGGDLSAAASLRSPRVIKQSALPGNVREGSRAY